MPAGRPAGGTVPPAIRERPPPSGRQFYQDRRCSDRRRWPTEAPPHAPAELPGQLRSLGARPPRPWFRPKTGPHCWAMHPGQRKRLRFRVGALLQGPVDGCRGQVRRHGEGHCGQRVSSGFLRGRLAVISSICLTVLGFTTARPVPAKSPGCNFSQHTETYNFFI